jgi:hypothetical protein
MRLRLSLLRASTSTGDEQGRRRRFHLGSTVLLAGLAVAAATLIPAGSAATTATTATKPYTANICAGTPTCVTNPTLPGGSTSTTVKLTIDNQASPQLLGSANATAPEGFEVTGVYPQPTGTTWAGRVLQLRNLNIASGAPQTFTISVRVPCQQPANPAWAITAKQSNSFNGPPGNDFTLVPPSSLTTNVASGCKLVFVRQPANAQVGRTITSVAYDPAAATVKVEVHDTNDQLITTATGTVSVTASSNVSFFSGNVDLPLSGGIATFPSLQSSAAGTYTLIASGTGYGSSDPSGSFKIGSKLVFLTQPADAQAGATITSADFDPAAEAVEVAVVPPDASGPTYTPIATALGSATLTPSPNTGFANTTANFSSGVATFSTLKSTTTGTYTVTASSTGSTSSPASDSFAITDFGTICPASLPSCTGSSSSSDKKTSSSVTSTGLHADTTLSITMLGSSTEQCAGFTPLPGSEGVSVDVRPLTDLTEVTLRFAKSIVNAQPDNGAAHFNVCFGGKIVSENPAVTPFPTKPGTPAASFDAGTGLYWGILPNCSGTPTTPCVASRNKDNSGDVLIVFDVPNPWDLRGYGG